MARGGGSLEDLWPLTTENLAKAIVESENTYKSLLSVMKPTIPYLDFAADLRAQLPLPRRELIMPEKKAMKETLKGVETSCHVIIKQT